jgi:hypothetical protein
VQVTIRDAGDLKAVNRALGQAANGKQLKKELRGRLRDVGRPLVAEVKSAWQSAPSGRGKVRRRGGSLRGNLARATRLEVRLTGKQAGVRVRTDGRRMPDGMKSLPGYAEGVRRRPWRHPVYGNRDVWVTQQPFPRFYKTVAGPGDEQRARRACEEAVEAVFKKIVRAV